VSLCLYVHSVINTSYYVDRVLSLPMFLFSLVEKATDGSQPSENWALYMEICDNINGTDEG